MLKTYTYQKDPSAEVSKLVFLLHGLGSNGQDLLSLAPQLAKELEEGVLFISPDAPDHCDMAPEGYEGSYQWFSLQDRDPKVMAENVKAASPKLTDYITLMVEKHKLEYKDVVLVGFSQGTMMSLYAGLRLPKPIAGILGYSGAMAVEPDELCHKTPITLIHGQSDDVVPFSASQSAHQVFEAKGYESQLHLRPGLPHGIDPEGQNIGKNFLISILT